MQSVLQHLYTKYLRGLEQYLESPIEEKASDILQNYRNHHHAVRMLKVNGEVVGFLILGWYPNCHSKCDYYICQAFVLPEYRRKGVMRSAVSEWIQEHGGVYCLDVISRNRPAQEFWTQVFKENGYDRSYRFEDEPHGIGPDVDTWYFEKT